MPNRFTRGQGFFGRVYVAAQGLYIAAVQVLASAAEINRVCYVAGRIVNCTASSLTLDEATHEGKTVTLNRAAGIAVRLPASTGGGAKYRLFVGTTFTGASTIKVNATPGTDIMLGVALLFADGGDTTLGFATAVDSDTVDLLGTGNSTGGIKGAVYEFEDQAAGVWAVRLVSDAAGTEATPFSATV